MPDGRSGLEAQGSEVFADDVYSGAALVDKNRLRCPAAQGLDSHRAGAGIQVGENGALDLRSQNIEERFAEAVRGRTHVEAGNAFEDPASKFASDDSH